MTVRRKVAPEKLILSTSEFLAMSQHEVEQWYEDHAPADPDTDPRYWANVATLSQRKLRQRIDELQRWVAGLAFSLAFTFVIVVLLVTIWR